jgi:hypothetical protein
VKHNSADAVPARRHWQRRLCVCGGVPEINVGQPPSSLVVETASSGERAFPLIVAPRACELILPAREPGEKGNRRGGKL